MAATTCPFCKPNWPNLDIVERTMPVGPAGSVAIIRPLNPVTDGHVLVIHREHDNNAAASFEASRRTSLLMAVAADYVNVNGLQANIITSIGPDATQTVLHTHVHIVPRRPGDGLPLPWTPQPQAAASPIDLAAAGKQAAQHANWSPAPGANKGHGYVYRRPDGARARCGGPALCSGCAVDLAKLVGVR